MAQGGGNVSSCPTTDGQAASCLRGVALLARREFRDAVASRWFLLYTVAFAVLAVGVSFMSMSGAGSSGFAGFSRTAAGLLNLITLVVPLMALTAGAAAISGERERGVLLYLLAQPISRTQLLLGKFVGLSGTLMCSILIGFGLSAGVLAWRAGAVGVVSFVMLGACSVALALGMLSVGLLISVLSRRSAVATGAALFVWLSLVFISDLGLMAGSMVFRLRVQEIFSIAAINPLQAFKMIVVSSMNGTLDVLGPVGAYASHVLGDQLEPVLLTTLTAWIGLPLLLAAAVFARRSSV